MIILIELKSEEVNRRDYLIGGRAHISILPSDPMFENLKGA